MDIDLAALRGLERERDISLDIIIPAIEQAMLVAYHRTEGARRLARVELDRKTGHVIVWARDEGAVDPETEERSEPGPEFDDTPAGFGRIAASTARQVIVQRLRDLEDEAIMGDFHGREGDIITGVIQQSSDPRYVMVCLLYTSDAADDLLCVDLGGRRIIKKKKTKNKNKRKHK